jgi:hypothetical protein
MNTVQNSTLRDLVALAVIAALTNVADHRPRAGDFQNATESSSRVSAYLLVGRLCFLLPRGLSVFSRDILQACEPEMAIPRKSAIFPPNL